MGKQSRSYGGILFLLIAVLCAPVVSLADEVMIINNVKAEVSTGGNSASLGEVNEGKSKSSVKIYTEVNGEIVTDIDEAVEDGEDFAFEETHIKPEVEVHTHVHLQSEGSTSTEDGMERSEETQRVESAASKEGEMSDEIKDREDAAEETNESHVETTFSIRNFVTSIIAYVFGIFK